MDFELNNKDTKSITSDYWEKASCKPQKDLKQAPPEMDVNLPIEDDYREQMMLSLSSARNLAKKVNRGSLKKYKAHYGKSARYKLRIGH